MIDNLFRGSPRMFFNNISVSWIQLSILLGDSTNLREGLVWNASILKITILNQSTLYKIKKPVAVHIQAYMHLYMPKKGLKISCDSPFSTKVLLRETLDVKIHCGHPEPIVLVIFKLKSMRWQMCYVLNILTKARAFKSTTTQRSCFNRAGAYPGLNKS